MRKRAKRVVVLSLSAIALLVSGGLLFIHTSVFQQWLLQRLETAAATAGYNVTAEQLHFNIFQLQASVENVTVDDGKSISARIGWLSIDIPSNALREDVIRITSLQADGVAIRIRSAESAPDSGGQVELPRITFDNLDIRNVSLTYSDGATTVQIPSLNIETQNGRGSLRFDAPITVSPDTRLAMPVVALGMTDQALEFGPMEWQFSHPAIAVAGSARGRFQWSPAIAANLNYSTDPFTYQNWQNLESSGLLLYENDVVKLTDFQIRSGAGSATGSAEIANGMKSVNLLWTSLNLSPAGLPATTGGDLHVQWREADFKDLSGSGSVVINSRQYGSAQSKVVIRDARANLDVTASGFDTRLHANVNTGLDQTLSGTFEGVNSRYGTARVKGVLGGSFADPRVNGNLTATGITYEDIGPVSASAAATLRSRVVAIDDIQAQLKNSIVTGGSLRVDLNSNRLTGEIPEVQLQLPDFSTNVKGSATLSAVVDGTIEKPSARITGSSDGVEIEGTRIDSVRLAGEVDASRFLLTEFAARQREGSLDASGAYTFSSDAIGGHVSISNLQVDEIQDASGIASLTADIGGTVKSPDVTFSGRVLDVTYQNQQHGDIDFEGRIQNEVASVRLQSNKYAAAGTAEVALKEPYAYTASLTADRSSIQYEQYGFTVNGGVQASGGLKPVTAERLHFDDFSVEGEGINLRASGSLSNGVQVNATADLSRLPVENVQVRGQARLQAVISGTVEDPRIEGSLETSDATVQAMGMPEPANIQAVVDFTRNEFKFRTVHAVYADATADIDGTGTLKGTGHFQFRVEGIKPERFFNDRPVAGMIGLQGEVDVTKPAIEGISGSVKVNQLDLSLGNIPVHQVQPIEFSFENQILTARNVVLEGLDTQTTLSGAADLRTRTLNFKVDGRTDLKIVEAFLPGSNPSGQISTSVAVAGTMENPTFDGFLRLVNMQLQISEPPVSVMNTNAEIQLRADHIQIASATGTVNGGQFSASGGADISASGLGNTAVQLNLTGAQTEYPEGFQSEISSRLDLSGSGTNLQISGNVDILNGAYRQDIDLTQEVISRVTARPTVVAGREAPPSTLEQIRLDVTVATPGVVSVENNVANFELEGAFRLRGSVENPNITGRASVVEGGEIYFGPQVGAASATQLERRDRYVISEGTIDFNNPIRTEPNFNFVATRELQGTDLLYIITLRATGTPDNYKTELTSDPELDQPNIVSLLLTGRRLDELQGNELLVAQEQAANYLSGRFGTLFQSAGSTFGLNTVRIDPVLVAQDEDLSAKLTVGKDITPNFNLVYSQNLSGPRAQTWIANYKALKDLLIRGVNQSDDNNLTLELRHDLKWGGGPDLARSPKTQDETKLSDITFEGSTLPMKDLLGRVTKTGKPFNSYRMNEDVRKLRQYYADNGFLGARIRATRNPRDGAVDVHFLIDEGPSITFAFVGAKVPKVIQEEIRQIWIRGFAELSSLRQSEARLLRHFRDENYLQAKVSGRDESPTEVNRRFVFDIAPGPQFEKPAVVFKGIDPIELNVTPGVILEDPKAIQDRIQNDLWKDGYLNASCTEPQLIIDGRDTRFEISVERGPRFSIGKIMVDSPEVLSFLPPGEGGRNPGEGMFTSAWLDRARQSIVSKYWEKGFNDVQVTAETRVPEVGTTVDVDFKIKEGAQQIVSRIEIEGNKSTKLDYILRQFTFKEGDPVDYSRVNLTRKKLYDTRLFRRADVNVVDGNDGYIVRAVLNEKPPWNFRYGFAVTDQLQTSDREFGVTADFSYSNLFGKAVTTGSSVKYTPDTHEGRLFTSVPVFLGKNVTTIGAVFRTRDLSIVESITDITGFTIQQQWQLRRNYVLSYDYSYKRNHTFFREPDPNNPISLDLTYPVARFNTTLSRDTRDDILNATKGAFLSNSFEIAPPGVGSYIQFLKNYSQFFRFRPLTKRVVWASAYRVGVAKGFHDQDLIPTERFRAGGGTTLRAFQQDQLATAGGNALFVLNQELRFPLLWRFSGVGFIDAGNIYPKIGNFNPFRLRYSPGVGIRIQTPLVLIRFDMGFNVSPRPGESPNRFSFGVGQAF